MAETKLRSERLLTVVEAEALTGRKASTWRADILKKKITYVKIGRSIRIPIEVINKLIADGWHNSVSQEPSKGECKRTTL